jgi:hypothetical protein
MWKKVVIVFQVTNSLPIVHHVRRTFSQGRDGGQQRAVLFPEPGDTRQQALLILAAALLRLQFLSGSLSTGRGGKGRRLARFSA